MATTQGPEKSIQSIQLLDAFKYSMYAILAYIILEYLRLALRPGLRSIPGPFIARFSKLYRLVNIARGDCPDFYLRVHEKYGQIVRLAPNFVSLSDPAVVPVIFGINHNYLKSGFYDTMSPYYKDKLMPSMFTARDPTYHTSLKRPVSQKFSMTSIKSLEPAADKCTSIFLDAMRDLEGQDVDLGVWCQYYAFDVIGSITFQRRFGFMEKRQDYRNMIADIDLGLKLPSIKHLTWNSNSLLRYAAVIGQVPEWHSYLGGNLWLLKALGAQPFVESPDPFRTIVKFTEDCIDDYDKTPAGKENQPDFLAWLRNDSKKGKPMSDRDLVNHLSNNLLAGSDTTAISLRAMFYFLVQTPHVYRKLQEEIDNADKAGKLSKYVTYAECLELPYLQAVMKEAMRCHPSVSMPLERLVPEGGAEFCGIQIPAGTVIGVNPVVIHHDKSIYGEDAAEFRPERWTDSDPERVKVMDRHLLTFGAGVRTCIGKNISIMEMGKFIPQILRYFDLEWASKAGKWRVETYWFAKQHGLICRFKSRKSLKG